MDCDPVCFVRFLSSRHYLDGSKDVSTEDKKFIVNCINSYTDNYIFSNTTLHSFVDNIAFVIAQTGNIDRATKILTRSYEEDQNDDNWLFEEIKQNNREITPTTIKEFLVSAMKKEKTMNLY